MKETTKILIAGPWVGEFGWELFAWQGYIRSLASEFDKVVCIGRPGHDILYEDFVDTYIPHYIYEVGACDSFFIHNYKFTMEHIDYEPKKGHINTYLFPFRIGAPPHTHFLEKVHLQNSPVRIIGPNLNEMKSVDLGFHAPSYVSYGTKKNTGVDLLFHARHRLDVRPEFNWSISNWEKIYKHFNNLGYNIGCIGTTKDSLCVEGTQDLRGLELREVVDYIASAKAIIGPSSGPMHLAALCKCPQIVWSVERDKRRYKINWNPHRTPVCFMGQHKWDPPVDYVIRKAEDFLATLS